MTKAKRAALVAGLTLALGAGALAQEGPWRNQRRDDDDNRGRATAGWQQGQRERDRNHRDRDRDQRDRDRDDRNRNVWNGDRDRDRDRDDRNRNVWNGDRDRDGDRDDQRRNGGSYGYPNGPYRGTYGNRGSGAYGYPGGYNNAGQFGFNDGLRDGQNDRATGHSFRPTYSGNYKHASDGYVSGVDRNSYVQAYRDAYMRGYQQGYQGGYGYGYPR